MRPYRWREVPFNSESPGHKRSSGVPAYRLFIDQPEIEEMPSSEMLDMFVEFLSHQYRKDVVEAKARFVKGLESQKKTGKNPFEGDPMFKE